MTQILQSLKEPCHNFIGIALQDPAHIEIDLWGGLGVDGRTMLKWTLKRQVSMRVIGLIRLRIGIIGEPL